MISQALNQSTAAIAAIAIIIICLAMLLITLWQHYTMSANTEETDSVNQQITLEPAAAAADDCSTEEPEMTAESSQITEDAAAIASEATDGAKVVRTKSERLGQKPHQRRQFQEFLQISEEQRKYTETVTSESTEFETTQRLQSDEIESGPLKQSLQKLEKDRKAQVRHSEEVSSVDIVNKQVQHEYKSIFQLPDKSQVGVRHEEVYNTTNSNVQVTVHLSRALPALAVASSDNSDVDNYQKSKNIADLSAGNDWASLLLSSDGFYDDQICDLMQGKKPKSSTASANLKSAKSVPPAASPTPKVYDRSLSTEIGYPPPFEYKALYGSTEEPDPSSNFADAIVTQLEAAYHCNECDSLQQQQHKCLSRSSMESLSSSSRTSHFTVSERVCMEVLNDSSKTGEPNENEKSDSRPQSEGNVNNGAKTDADGNQSSVSFMGDEPSGRLQDEQSNLSQTSAKALTKAETLTLEISAEEDTYLSACSTPPSEADSQNSLYHTVYVRDPDRNSYVRMRESVYEKVSPNTSERELSRSNADEFHECQEELDTDDSNTENDNVSDLDSEELIDRVLFQPVAIDTADGFSVGMVKRTVEDLQLRTKYRFQSAEERKSFIEMLNSGKVKEMAKAHEEYIQKHAQHQSSPRFQLDIDPDSLERFVYERELQEEQSGSQKRNSDDELYMAGDMSRPTLRISTNEQRNSDDYAQPNSQAVTSKPSVNRPSTSPKPSATQSNTATSRTSPKPDAAKSGATPPSMSIKPSTKSNTQKPETVRTLDQKSQSSSKVEGKNESVQHRAKSDSSSVSSSRIQKLEPVAKTFKVTRAEPGYDSEDDTSSDSESDGADYDTGYADPYDLTTILKSGEKLTLPDVRNSATAAHSHSKVSSSKPHLASLSEDDDEISSSRSESPEMPTMINTGSAGSSVDQIYHTLASAVNQVPAAPARDQATHNIDQDEDEYMEEDIEAYSEEASQLKNLMQCNKDELLYLHNSHVLSTINEEATTATYSSTASSVASIGEEDLDLSSAIMQNRSADISNRVSVLTRPQSSGVAPLSSLDDEDDDYTEEYDEDDENDDQGLEKSSLTANQRNDETALSSQAAQTDKKISQEVESSVVTGPRATAAAHELPSTDAQVRANEEKKAEKKHRRRSKEEKKAKKKKKEKEKQDRSPSPSTSSASSTLQKERQSSVESPAGLEKLYASEHLYKSETTIVHQYKFQMHQQSRSTNDEEAMKKTDHRSEIVVPSQIKVDQLKQKLEEERRESNYKSPKHHQLLKDQGKQPIQVEKQKFAEAVEMSQTEQKLMQNQTSKEENEEQYRHNEKLKQEQENQKKLKLQQEQMQKIEQEQKQKLERERKQILEQQQKEKLESEQKQKLEQEQKQKLEHEKKQKLEQQQKEKLEQEQKEKLEQERLLKLEEERKKQEQEQQREEQERQQRREQRRQKREQEKQQKLEQERQQKLEQKRQKQEQKRLLKLEQEKQEKEAQEKLEQEQQNKLDQERKEKEQQHKLEQERLQKLEQERLETLEQERLWKLEQERLRKLEQERLRKLEQERLEKLEQERLQKLEQERLQKLEQERLEKLEQERLKKLEQEKIEKELLLRKEQERLHKEELDKQEELKRERRMQKKERRERKEQERIRKEKERQKKLEEERRDQILKQEQEQKQKLEKEKLEEERKMKLEQEQQQKLEEEERAKKIEQERLQKLEEERLRQAELQTLEQERLKQVELQAQEQERQKQEEQQNEEELRKQKKEQRRKLREEKKQKQLQEEVEKKRQVQQENAKKRQREQLKKQQEGHLENQPIEKKQDILQNQEQRRQEEGENFQQEEGDEKRQKKLQQDNLVEQPPVQNKETVNRSDSSSSREPKGRFFKKNHPKSEATFKYSETKPEVYAQQQQKQKPERKQEQQLNQPQQQYQQQLEQLESPKQLSFANSAYEGVVLRPESTSAQETDIDTELEQPQSTKSNSQEVGYVQEVPNQPTDKMNDKQRQQQQQQQDQLQKELNNQQKDQIKRQKNQDEERALQQEQLQKDIDQQKRDQFNKPYEAQLRTDLQASRQGTDVLKLTGDIGKVDLQEHQEQRLKLHGHVEELNQLVHKDSEIQFTNASLQRAARVQQPVPQLTVEVLNAARLNNEVITDDRQSEEKSLKDFEVRNPVAEQARIQGNRIQPQADTDPKSNSKAEKPKVFHCSLSKSQLKAREAAAKEAAAAAEAVAAAENAAVEPESNETNSVYIPVDNRVGEWVQDTNQLFLNNNGKPSAVEQRPPISINNNNNTNSIINNNTRNNNQQPQPPNLPQKTASFVPTPQHQQQDRESERPPSLLTPSTQQSDSSLHDSDLDDNLPEEGEDNINQEYDNEMRAESKAKREEISKDNDGDGDEDDDDDDDDDDKEEEEEEETDDEGNVFKSGPKGPTGVAVTSVTPTVPASASSVMPVIKKPSSDRSVSIESEDSESFVEEWAPLSLNNNQNSIGQGIGDYRSLQHPRNSQLKSSDNAGAGHSLPNEQQPAAAATPRAFNQSSLADSAIDFMLNCLSNKPVASESDLADVAPSRVPNPYRSLKQLQRQKQQQEIMDENKRSRRRQQPAIKRRQRRNSGGANSRSASYHASTDNRAASASNLMPPSPGLRRQSRSRSRSPDAQSRSKSFTLAGTADNRGQRPYKNEAVSYDALTAAAEAERAAAAAVANPQLLRKLRSKSMPLPTADATTIDDDFVLRFHDKQRQTLVPTRQLVYETCL